MKGLLFGAYWCCVSNSRRPPPRSVVSPACWRWGWGWGAAALVLVVLRSPGSSFVTALIGVGDSYRVQSFWGFQEARGYTHSTSQNLRGGFPRVPPSYELSRAASPLPWNYRSYFSLFCRARSWPGTFVTPDSHRIEPISLPSWHLSIETHF